MNSEKPESARVRYYLTVLGGWWWLILVGVVVGAGSALAASRLTTPIYQASTMLLISEGQTVTGSDYSAVLMSGQLAKTYSHLLTASPIMDEVSVRLGVPAPLLKVKVDLIRDTQLLQLVAQHPDPNMAASIANTVPQVFIEQTGRAQIARAASSQQTLAREMANLQTEIVNAQRGIDEQRLKSTPDTAEMARQETLLAQYRVAYSRLLESYEQIRVAQAAGLSTITVAEQAKVPKRPFLPRTLPNTLLGGLAGVMLAVGVAFLSEYLDDTLKTPGDIEQALHLPTWAAIAQMPRMQADGGTPLMATAKSGIAEGFRILRTNLQFSTADITDAGSRGVVLLLTSTQALEGKTTTLANLGMSLAQIDKRVILVDADLRRPSLHRHLGVPNKVGVAGVLTKQQPDVEQAIEETCIRGLGVVAAGHVPANPTELLDSPEMPTLIERLRALADYVIIDAPPVLAAADACVLAQKVDGVVLVVEAGRTRIDAAQRAVAALEGVKTRILGAVLNRASPGRGADDYGRYYAGSYGELGAGSDRGARSAPGTGGLKPLGRAMGRLFSWHASNPKLRAAGKGGSRSLAAAGSGAAPGRPAAKATGAALGDEPARKRSEPIGPVRNETLGR